MNPSELVKCSSENICLVLNFFVKCLTTSCVGSVINVKIDVNLQDILPKCLGYCGDTVGPPEDEQHAARNMLRSVV